MNRGDPQYEISPIANASRRAYEATGGEVEHLYTYRPTKRSVRVACRGAAHPFHSEADAIAWLHLMADRADEAAARARHPAGRAWVVGVGEPPETPT